MQCLQVRGGEMILKRGQSYSFCDQFITSFNFSLEGYDVFDSTQCFRQFPLRDG